MGFWGVKSEYSNTILKLSVLLPLFYSPKSYPPELPIIVLTVDSSGEWDFGELKVSIAILY
jgi:hypothetical protein